MISHTLLQGLFNAVDDATDLCHHQLASTDDDDQQRTTTHTHTVLGDETQSDRNVAWTRCHTHFVSDVSTGLTM